MLEPNSRRLLFDALAPPAGYRLDFTIGTSYTLDLLALLAAPVAFAFSDWQDREGRPTPDPLALLKAVRQYADRMCLFCQAGKIQIPAAFQPLLVSLESSVVEALAPRGGSFHPKVWFLRFESHDDPNDVIYRFLCLSRNMTFDRAWDTMLCLEGPLSDRVNAYSQNHALGHFVESLPAVSIRKLSREWSKRVDTLAYEIRRVAFETPDGIDEVAFWPIGIDPSSSADGDWPFFPSKRSLVVSPFVSDSLLNELAGISEQIELISRPEQLEILNQETLESFSDVWILDDTAEPEPAEIEESSEAHEAKAHSVANAVPLVGLHAKVYVIDEGWNASVFTGSANATHAAFHQNVEFLTQLRGKKSQIGVAAILGEGQEGKPTGRGAACLADMLQPFTLGGPTEPVDDSERRFEQIVDELAKRIASSQPVAVCGPSEDGAGFRISLKPSKRTRWKLDSSCTVSVRLASRPMASPLPIELDQAQWATFDSLAMLSLTSFFVFSITTEEPKKLSREFVLNIPLIDEPDGRREALLKHLLSDKDRVLRFMMLLLSDADPSDFADFFGGNGEKGTAFHFSNLLDGRTLFESLMRCVDRDPARLQQVSEMITDLASTDEGRALLPDDLDSIWKPIWTVAERRIAKATKRGRR